MRRWMNTKKNAGKVIIETLCEGPACRAGMHPSGHGVLPGERIRNGCPQCRRFEEIARMAFYTEALPGKNVQLPEYIIIKHYNRKHGKNATYGQKTDH